MKKLALVLLLLLLTIAVFVSCTEAGNTTAESGTTFDPAAETTKPEDSTTASLDTTVVSGGNDATDTTGKNLDATVTTDEGVTSSSASVTTAQTPTTATKAPISTTKAPETTAPITYTAANWMNALPEDCSLASIAMPGTHDSGATKDMILAGTAKCQSLTVSEQLAAGVRYFDIRLRRVDGALHVYHGTVDQELTFEEVLTACYTFLSENPSEALIMCIKEETDAEGTNDAFDAMVKSYINQNSIRWYTGSAIPTLGTVRGKIVLIRRYATSGTYGFNASSGWSDNTTFTMTSGASRLSVQDYYDNESPEKKWEAVESFFATMKPQKNTYYLNNTSGYKAGLFGIPNINTVSDHVNPKLIAYLKTSPDIVGIVATDFMTAEIAALIYELNFS